RSRRVSFLARRCERRTDFAASGYSSLMVASLPRLRGLLLPVCGLAGALSGCGSHGAGPLGEVGVFGGDDGGSFASPGAPDGGSLDAHIESGGIAVQLVTLGCSAGCADVQAIATGGNPPYSFAWQDGAVGAARHLCPSATESFEVTASDTGGSGELPRPSQTAKAQVTAQVLACPDAGEAGGPLCIANPSF